VHAVKSALVMGDVALVVTGIQLQLSIFYEKMQAAQLLGNPSAGHHEHLAHVHHYREHACAQGSIAILSILLIENLAVLWATGWKKFIKKTTQVTDFVVVATSLVLELVFDKLTGFERIVAELWRFVRIVHGSYETFFHSPFVAPLVAPDKGHH